MESGRTPRSTHYDGWIYGVLIEPLLRGVHGFVEQNLPPGERVLDACCGTGALSRRLAAAGRRVHGVDLSPRNIAYAERRALRAGFSPDRLRFELADVACLEAPSEGRYDVATVVMALHEMPSDQRVPVLQALARAAEQVLVVDFAIPMPKNLAGLRNRAMELAAGREHFTGFRDYTRRGGLLPLVSEANLVVKFTRTIDAGSLQVAMLASGGEVLTRR